MFSIFGFREASATRPRPRPRPKTHLHLECLEDRAVPAASYLAMNIASDQPGMAQFTDPHLVNPWGIALPPDSGSFWIANNGTGTFSLYSGGVNGQPMIMATSPDGSATVGGAPTGVVYNSDPKAFLVGDTAARFIFASETGQIFAWVPDSSGGKSFEVFAADDGAIYKGITIGVNAEGPFLFAADFHNGKIDVFYASFGQTKLVGSFADYAMFKGYAPFNIQNLDGKIYVTYARQDVDHEDDVAGPGLGFVDVFDTNGNLLQRLTAGGALNAPWGLAMAPANFGQFSNTLLVGNFGDGHINSFDPKTGAWLGALTDGAGQALVIDGLWGMTFGNGVTSGDANALYFTAGPGDESHGAFGVVREAANLTKQFKTSRQLTRVGSNFMAGDLIVASPMLAKGGTFTIQISNVPDNVVLRGAVGRTPDGDWLIQVKTPANGQKPPSNGSKTMIRVPLMFQLSPNSSRSVFAKFTVVSVFGTNLPQGSRT